MISKKICMLGSFSVGKTSLVKRFVESIFSEKYRTTIGVHISKKKIEVNDKEYQLMIWDIEGADNFISINKRYLKGAAGCLLVIDGTRPKTAEIVDELYETMNEQLGSDCAFCILVNKCDLAHEWQIEQEQFKIWEERNWTPIFTSAKTGENVEKAFHQLIMQMELTS